MVHGGPEPKRTLFISRAGADADFAAQVGGILEGAGYTVVLQQWDFANRNFIERIHATLADDTRVVGLLSPAYLCTDYCAAEWQNAIAGDPLNTKGRLILLRIAECEPVGLLAGIAYWDVVPIRDNRNLLAEVVLDAVRQERRDTAPAAGPYWRAPRTILDAEAIRSTPGFTGRESELEALRAALEQGRQIVAVYGLGGMGKSSLVREYAWRNRERYAVVWWLDAQTERGIIDGLLRLGALFIRGLDALADRRAAAQQVITTVLPGHEKPVLLIFDNLEEEQLLHVWCPRAGAQALVTSRESAWESEAATIRLDVWPLDEAVEYMRRESGSRSLSDADARAIVESLGALPLAVAHAAAYLRATVTVTPQRYLEHIAEQLARAPRGADYPHSVFATFQAAIAEAERQAAGSAAILSLAAWFAPDAIPEELFRLLDSHPEGLRPSLPEGAPALDLRAALRDELRVDEALGTLHRLSLVAFSESARTYGMHRLVQLTARDLAGAEPRAWIEAAIATANAVFPQVNFAAWPQCERLLPHVRAALNALPMDAISTTAATLAGRCGVYLTDRGAYPDAEALCRRALTIQQKALGADHPDVARTLNNLANVYWYEGRYSDAKPLHMEALAIRETALGPDHPDVAASLSNLGVLNLYQARYAEAEPLYARALAIREKALGADHPDVAFSLNNLGLLYREQGRHAEADPLLVRASATLEKAFGPDHPLVATILSSLGKLRVLQQRNAEAEPLIARALAIFERSLGPDHPDITLSLTDLGLLYVDQARYAEAEPLLARALAVREKALAADHPLVADSLDNVGFAYRNQGRYAEAEPLFARALAMRERMLDAAHPDLALSLQHLGELYVSQGRDAEARTLFTRALTIREKAFGPDHPSTQETRARIADLL